MHPEWNDIESKPDTIHLTGYKSPTRSLSWLWQIDRQTLSSLKDWMKDIAGLALKLNSTRNMLNSILIAIYNIDMDGMMWCFAVLISHKIVDRSRLSEDRLPFPFWRYYFPRMKCYVLYQQCYCRLTMYEQQRWFTMRMSWGAIDVSYLSCQSIGRDDLCYWCSKSQYVVVSFLTYLFFFFLLCN